MPTKGTASKKSTRKPPTTKLKDEIKTLKSDLKQQEDKYLRLKAEFDNYRRRKSEEIIALLKYGNTRAKSLFQQIHSIGPLLFRSTKPQLYPPQQ